MVKGPFFDIYVGGYLNFLQLLLRTLTLLRAFADSGYVLSLSLNKERTKESQPKAAAFGNRSSAALQRRLERKTYTLSLHRPPQSHHERQICQSEKFCGFPKGIKPFGFFSFAISL